MSAQQQITNQIRQRIAAGEDAMSALRAVCGAAIVDEMIENVWRTLRERSTRMDDEPAAKPDHDTRHSEGYDCEHDAWHECTCTGGAK
jgi:hypothetical protein